MRSTGTVPKAAQSTWDSIGCGEAALAGGGHQAMFKISAE